MLHRKVYIKYSLLISNYITFVQFLGFEKITRSFCWRNFADMTIFSAYQLFDEIASLSANQQLAILGIS